MEGDIKAWRESARDRILRSADSALVILHVITSPKMPKKVHLEESVDQVLALTKFHLDKNVYPQFDPVYKAESKGGSIVCVTIISYVSSICTYLCMYSASVYCASSVIRTSVIRILDYPNSRFVTF